MLDDEERGDTELRNQFQGRWTRTVSSTLTVPLRTEAKKYMDIIQNAISADKIVQEKYRMNRDCVVLLSKQTVKYFRKKNLLSLFLHSFSMKLLMNYLQHQLPVLYVMHMSSRNYIVSWMMWLG
jgi:hypothetical protein